MMSNAIVLMANVKMVGVHLVTREITVKKVKSFLFFYDKNYAPIRISNWKRLSYNIWLTIQNSLFCTINYNEMSH